MNKIYKNGYNFFFWNYEKQTKIKHFVFKEYFDVWVKIVGKWNVLNFFDCYAGCGAYVDENDRAYYGSPILAAETIEKNIEKLNRKVNLNPTFFFIDPFGFTIKYKTLKRIMAIPKSEIFLNFMFTQVNRFLIDDIEEVLNELFGCEDWKSLRSLTGKQREQSIVELFRMQLKKIARFVFYYRMSFPHKERTYYYLFHLTNHQMGCSIMKSCFARFNYGKVEYRGPKHGERTLFDLQEIKIDEVKGYFTNKYLGVKKTYDEIICENIDEVPYLEKEIRESIKALESENNVKVKRVDSKTKRGLMGNDLIVFNPRHQ